MGRFISVFLVIIFLGVSTASFATGESQPNSSDTSEKEIALLGPDFSGGAISSNSKMLQQSHPYIISEPIDIPEGVSLSIEPGVQIVSTAGVLFRVQGSLDMQGDEKNPVRVQLSGAFVSAVETRSGSDPESLKIEFAEVQGGTPWQLDYPSFSHLHIRNNDFLNQECGYRTNSIAIRAANSTFDSNFVSGTCGFNFNINFGVFGPRGTFSVSNNHFFGDPKTAAWLSASALRGDTLTLRRNTFTDLTKRAIASGFFETKVDADDNYWPNLNLAEARSLAEGSEDTIFAPASVLLNTMLVSPDEDTPAGRRFEEKVTPPKAVKPTYTVNQKTLATFQGEVTTLTNQQKAQVKAAVDANPNAEKFICTGIRYYDQPMAVNIMVRKRAKAACEYAKQLNPSLSTWFQNKPTQARSYAGKVLLTIKTTIPEPEPTPEPEPEPTQNCQVYDFNSIFYEDYYPGTLWVSTGQKRTITWSVNSPQIFDEFVVRPFTEEENEWIRLALESWDTALESISFREVDSSSADLVVGFVALENAPNQQGATGYWNAWWNDSKIRTKATIKLRAGSDFLKSKNGFIHATQHEVGNVLGLGDIRPSPSIDSVMEDPWQIPFGNVPLSDFDVELIRQLYGESKCTGS